MLGKVDTALPHFPKTALEASPNHGQYWISYIDALIKLAVVLMMPVRLEQVAAGLSGDAVTELESRLSGSDINKFVKAYNNLEYENVFKWAQEF